MQGSSATQLASINCNPAKLPPKARDMIKTADWSNGNLLVECVLYRIKHLGVVISAIYLSAKEGKTYLTAYL